MTGRDEGAAATHATTSAGNRGVGQTSGAPSFVPATESSPEIPLHPTAVEPVSPRSSEPGRGAPSSEIIEAATVADACGIAAEAIALGDPLRRRLAAELLPVLAKRARRDEAAELARAHETIAQQRRQLGLFAAGFKAEAAEAVVGRDSQHPGEGR